MKTLILLFSVLFTTMSFAQVTSYVPSSGLVGWWPFTGNAIDSSGNANNGIVNGATLTTDRFGNVNSAFNFDGVNDWININNSNSLNPTSQITISAWVNTLAYNLLGASMVVNKGWDQGPGHYDLLVLSSNYKSRFVIGAGIYVESNSIINSNQWTLITVSIDSLTMKIYINGTLENTVLQNNNNSFGTNTDPLYIGKHDYNNAPYYFNGKIDDIGIWNRALTPQEITNLYTSTVPPTVAVLSGDATICAGASTNLSVAVTGGTAPYTVTVTDGTNNYSATGASPVSIAVSPTATSTYTIVSVSGGGTGIGNTGTATVTVTAVPTQPTLACYETAVFNTTSCSWDVTGTQPAQPTLACYETATFNTTTCSWVISGPQAPQKMSYQAVIRNSNDSLLNSTPVGMRISLVQGAPSGTVVFSETQTATTNANGLVSLQIGMGTAVSGTFACIDWAAGPYYVKTETDLTGGTNYTIISSNELMSVPYALFSANGPTGALPPGTVAGEMNYWNGTAWVTVAPGLSLPGNQALTLSLCNGVPTWGPCPAVLPTVTTTAVSSIYNNITSGGAVTSDGGASLTAWGVCWSTSANPTLANSFLQNYVSSVGFSNLLSGLAANTTYYVRAYATNSAGTAYGNEVSFTTGNILFLTIGQSYQGGIIAYILQPDDSGYDATMQHGLIVAPSAQGIVQWGCQGTGISGADGTAIGTGAQNTIDIMNGCSTAVKAASLCGDLVLGGYNDWYLPSKDELHQLYINRVAIGGFAGNWHWSSSEYDNTDAWFQHFLGEGLTNGMKNHTCIVRAVRAF